MAQIKTGDSVRLTYTGRLANGQVFDTSDEQTAQTNGVFVEGRRYGPLAVQVGTGTIIQGLDRNLLGMEEGEAKEITIAPEDAYGIKDPALTAVLPRALFQQHSIEPAIGMVIQTNEGQGHITSISPEAVEVDYNHPLAGETLIFAVKVESIEPV
jgi:FKBP-type peptidyl-prolyl cis-trans isomerase SlyD